MGVVCVLIYRLRITLRRWAGLAIPGLPPLTVYYYTTACSCLSIKMDTMALLLERGLSSDLEASLIRILTFVMFVFSLMLLAEGSEAPYGRYARQYKGGCSYPLNARVGWFVQEIPAFVMPILCLLLVNVETSKVHNGLTVNRVLLGGLIAHYINR